ncbi:deoxyribodipyrimidine photolyase-related protein [Friedmanniella endophytica]|uniref:Deoxyribodipyrimidine photolyase-related protein n=1 Tax=Microlunatus kandeliicorticis TaxID=1759536 RepID=A0A7W3IT97_9ACTN|nr:cryptochrome/photolyase family protein [Microlunatus kandeliicorticis]MBA8794846.1 deoxyribodipyrimidine photolyase-related protein [Microlunatus kandeliicorticis]
MAQRRRWLFGDQLGPHFLDGTRQKVLMIESKRVFARRRFHRQKAHLILSAMRHRADELGRRCDYRRTDTFREALDRIDEPLDVCQPTSWAALHFCDQLATERDLERLPARGFATARQDFAAWADGRQGKRLLMEDFYREARARLDVLMEGSEPVTGQWNYDHDNREPPPRADTLGLPEPYWPTEDAIDDEVRADLDAWEAEGSVSFVGQDAPRTFAATRREALAALHDFVEHRLPTFGTYEDAMLREDRWMSHSMLSAPLNLGLLDPLEVVRAAEDAYREGHAPIAAVEGFVRQLIGWRDYIWNLYWWFGEDYRDRNKLNQRRQLPDWFADLDPSGTDAACLQNAVGSVAETGWAHHIPRLMVLGNYALQQGWKPQAVLDWFHRSFVDGYDWVMVPNVIGMSQHADGGQLATKPYLSGGSYINKMSDFCGSCRYDPKKRVGEDACPFTGGYWRFLHKHRERFAGNHRMAQAIRGLDRLSDLDELLAEG